MELTIKTMKGIVHKYVFNPHMHVAQNYNVVEDLAQYPSAISMLEVLQNYPARKKALLCAIRCIHPSYSNLVISNHEDYSP